MSDSYVVEEGGDFERELPPAGPINSVFWKWFDVGLQPNRLGAPFKVIVFCWETEYRYQTGDYKGKRWICYQKYRASFGKKSYLRRDLENWKGEPFGDEYLVDGKLKFDLAKIIKGKPALLTLIHNNGWANLSAVARLPIPPYTRLAVETPDDYMPPFVKKLLDQKLVEENRSTTEIAEKGWSEAERLQPSVEPTEKEVDIF
jgi:hypothetical protein